VGRRCSTVRPSIAFSMASMRCRPWTTPAPAVRWAPTLLRLTALGRPVFRIASAIAVACATWLAV